MDKKAINIIIIVAVVLAAGAVIVLKFSGPKDQQSTCCGPAQQGDDVAKKLPKIIKISSLGKRATPCSPCGVLARVISEVQAQYPGKFTVETYYSTDKNGQAAIEKYNVDSFSFLDRPVQLIFLDSEGEKSKTQLDLYATKEQIVEALKEVGVE
ncbi:unnamed protein product [marine sediment metagenome]|uniref:Thioredoxin domain-containing protein n=1 Tax=marine sediment metagenome TaxID=412755 RepID=X0RNS0_9ZZZZ